MHIKEYIMAFQWMILVIFVLIIILSIVAYYAKKYRKTPTDYYSLFIMGIIWLPFGLILDNNVLTILGIVFLIIGLVNKNKWKKNKKSWDKLSKDKKRIKIIIIGILSVLVLAGLVLLFSIKQGFI